MKDSNLPSISLIIPTLNNGAIVGDFLKLISKQNYPKNKVEIIVTDGGSSDETVKIAKKYGAEVYANKKVLAEPGVTLGMSKARGDILIVLATDNYLYDPNSFQKYANTFSDSEVYAAFPRHESKNWDSIFTKYINVFTDPFNHFVYGYSANGRTFKKIYKTLFSNDIYDLYDFSSAQELPLIAFAQGFAVRSSYIRKTRDSMDDIKPVIDLIKEGKNVAFIHSLPLYHHTVTNVAHFIRKQRWGTRNAISKKNYGISYRSQNLSRNQRFRMKIWPFYALSFVAPLIHSIYHLVKDREPMWIYHAPLCFISATASLYEVLIYNMFHKGTVSRQT